ncbi:hypothetical protein GCM10010393_32000 [Streptomyces gobitricini]|uniref:Uncharacterized protein n=1 Tax=Streptomyces gobitricini TaxID=68211 RepID=A0ABN3M8S2_9ACTN
MGAPRDQDDLLAGLGQAPADGGADRARTDDDVPHGVSLAHRPPTPTPRAAGPRQERAGDGSRTDTAPRISPRALRRRGTLLHSGRRVLARRRHSGIPSKAPAPAPDDMEEDE